MAYPAAFSAERIFWLGALRGTMMAAIVAETCHQAGRKSPCGYNS
jgi:hypothetical protein